MVKRERGARKLAFARYILPIFARALYIVAGIVALAIALFGAIVGLAMNDPLGFWFAVPCAFIGACIWVAAFAIRRVLRVNSTQHWWHLPAP